jgi:Cu/Ag efflux pump CusA
MTWRSAISWIEGRAKVLFALFAASLLAAVALVVPQSSGAALNDEGPIVLIKVMQPGASPVAMEQFVAQPIEEATRSLDGIDEINTTVREGSVFIVLFFQSKVNENEALNGVRDAVKNVKATLPSDITELQILLGDGESGKFKFADLKDQSR